MKKMWQWALPAMLLVGSCGLSLAQSINAGDIRGSVVDSTGALVPGVTVTVTNVDTGVTFTFQTNKDGIYDTNSIVPGHYKLTFVKPGFETFVRGPITLQVGNTTVNANLSVGAQTEQVVVNTDLPLLQTESGDQTATLDSKQMAQLPQMGANWENFMILLPGTTGANANQGVTNPGQSVSANGNLPYSNILADGASTTLSHSQNANPAVFETVDELQVSLSSFSAQFGIGGMIINQISKGGTNQFHGAAYNYFQNSWLKSHDNTNYPTITSIAKIPTLRYNDFGGSVGGPVLKNKAFFYFNYDQIINHGGASNSYQTVPTESIKAGDFSTETRTIYDPLTQTWATDAKGNSYPVRKTFAQEYGNGNKLPSSLLDPVALAFQKFYPTPSSHLDAGMFVPGAVNSKGLLQNNWYSSVPSSTPYRKYFGRFDYTVSEKNRINLSDTQSDTPVLYPNGVTVCPVGCQSGDVDNNNAQITDVWTINNNITNEARIGYTWQGNFFADLTLNKGYAAKLGWQFSKADTIPAIQFTNTYPYAWIQPQSNAVYKEHVFDPSDVVTMVHGKHIIHFGGEMLIYRDDSTAWGNTNAGTFQFSGGYTQNWTTDAGICGSSANGAACADNQHTGVEYADLLLGLSTNWSASVAPEYGGRMKSPQFFIQDDYKIRPNLTINLGLRYQINHGWTEVHGNLSSFDPTLVNPATGTLGAYWYGSTRDHALMKDVYNTFLPRVGASWLLDPKTTVRAGFGLYSYNWSLDNYGGNNSNYGIGSRIASSGNGSDQTSGRTPYVKLGGNGTIFGTSNALPYSASSTRADRYNGQDVGYLSSAVSVPKIYQWNLAVQRQIGGNMAAEVAYVGSHGFNLKYGTDLNAIPADKLALTDTQYRPYTQYNSISANTENGISNYNSLQASINKRMSHGLQFGANYVWSHFLDSQDSAGWGSHMGPTDSQQQNNPDANYSNSNFDARHVVKAQVVYRLPFGVGAQFFNNSKLIDAALGGWQISATSVMSSGHPFSVFATSDTYQHAGSQFPNRNPGVSLYASHRTPQTWFNPSAFTDPGPGHFGTVRRNSLYGPGFQSVNMSGSKTYTLPWEGIKFQIRADVTNPFNHTSWGQAGGGLGSYKEVNGVYTIQPNSSPQITGSQVTGRNVQFVGRITF